jgi:hypothetical protein
MAPPVCTLTLKGSGWILYGPFLGSRIPISGSRRVGCGFHVVGDLESEQTDQALTQTDSGLRQIVKRVCFPASNSADQGERS